MANKHTASANKTKTKKVVQKDADGSLAGDKFPRHDLEHSLRIPKAVLDQNAGKACTDSDAAGFAGLGFHGPTRMEISSAIKFGLLSRPEPGHVAITDLAKKIFRPQNESDELEGLRTAAIQAPVLSDIYSHYRGEYLPDAQFLNNALQEKFHVSKSKTSELIEIFLATMKTAKLLEAVGTRTRIVDVTHSASRNVDNARTLEKLGKQVEITQDDSCFLMMPFAEPIGGYYESIYAKAIQKAGLKPVRADNELFGTGKIMDQIWRGIFDAKVLVAELTTRNPNVFYELGLAHALGKPVILVSGTESDVPFDLRHIRVVYYNTSDPFWGQKLIDKVSERILSALNNPEEAILKRLVIEDRNRDGSSS